MFKNGDIVVCIDSEYAQQELTVGYQYQIINTEPGFVEICTDNIEKKWLFEDRFSPFKSNITKEDLL